MTDTKPEALRLADWLKTSVNTKDHYAANELRRLHEENERLLAANRDSTNYFDALMADHKKLQNENETLKKCMFQMQNAAIELAKPEQHNSIWILTREINQYDQDGEYFVGAWNQKPMHQMLTELGVPQNRLRKVLDGGGRVYPEEEWFYLKEQK